MARLTLADGRALDYQVRRSARAKYMRMQLHPTHGLLVTQPPGVSARALHQWVLSQQPWIAAALQKLAQHPPPAAAVSSLPERLALLATGENLHVIYTPSARKSITLHYLEHATLTLTGAVSDPAHCQQALRQWLRSYAQVHLSKQLRQVAAETGLHYVSCRIKGQQTRWGSCSARGNINLNEKLMLLPPEWVRYVLIHELCHTVEMNHSKRFWALVAGFVPEYKAIHVQMKGAMGQLPGWVR
jgi:predicted metal-dependent hydrolase